MSNYWKRFKKQCYIRPKNVIDLMWWRVYLQMHVEAHGYAIVNGYSKRCGQVIICLSPDHANEIIEKIDKELKYKLRKKD